MPAQFRIKVAVAGGRNLFAVQSGKEKGLLTLIHTDAC